MTPEELIKHARRLAEKVAQSWPNDRQFYSAKSQSVEFLRQFSGLKSSFTQTATNSGAIKKEASEQIAASLDAYADYIQDGLFQGISPERKAQIDVVSDLLEQAQSLLEN